MNDRQKKPKETNNKLVIWAFVGIVLFCAVSIAAFMMFYTLPTK